MKATVVITTKNRKEELRMALTSAFEQVDGPEVLVIDDGSTDGTSEMVQSEFPGTVLHRFEDSKGYIVRRNEAAALATGDFLFSLDDDAAFSGPNVVRQTLREFGDPRVGAVAIPYIEPHKENRVMQQAPERGGIWIADRFIGTAHALRRDLFLKLGGYRENLVHQGEESDYCIRMLGAGFHVRLGNAPPIIHYESPKRDYSRMDFYGRRNDVLFHWHNTPMPDLLWRLPSSIAGGFVCAARVRRWRHMVSGLGVGCMEIAKGCERSPVSRETARKFMRLRRAGGTRLEDYGGFVQSAKQIVDDS